MISVSSICQTPKSPALPDFHLISLFENCEMKNVYIVEAKLGLIEGQVPSYIKPNCMNLKTCISFY